MTGSPTDGTWCRRHGGVSQVGGSLLGRGVWGAWTSVRDPGWAEVVEPQPTLPERLHCVHGLKELLQFRRQHLL